MLQKLPGRPGIVGWCQILHENPRRPRANTKSTKGLDIMRDLNLILVGIQITGDQFYGGHFSKPNFSPNVYLGPRSQTWVNALGIVSFMTKSCNESTMLIAQNSKYFFVRKYNPGPLSSWQKYMAPSPKQVFYSFVCGSKMGPGLPIASGGRDV